jgi:hypothetical protein
LSIIGNSLQVLTQLLPVKASPVASGETAARGHYENELLEAAHTLLARRLPPDWSVRKGELDDAHGALDLVVNDGNGAECSVLVEAKPEFSSRDAQALTAGLPRRLRLQSEAPLLVVAPYISPSVREHLERDGISYVDLTGDIRMILDSPGLFIETQGLHQDPSARSATNLRGGGAGAVVRLLVDVRPPYTAAELATATKMNEGYVSRILGILLNEGLIERPSRGPIADVDWQGLIRRRAQAVDLLNRRDTHRFSAPGGLGLVLRAEAMGHSDAVVTGSFAAARLAGVTSPAILVAYSQDPRALATRLRLATAPEDSDVFLIRADSPVVFDRVELDDGVAYAAPSQTAIDCLAGRGTMASEGMAVVDWMRANEERWRLSSIDDLFGSIRP